MAVVELAIEDEEYRIVVYERCDDFCLGPFRLGIKLFGELVPTTLICDGDLCEVVVEDSSVEVNYELLCIKGTILVG